MPIIIKPKVEDYIKVALRGIYTGKSFKRSLWMQRLTLPVIAMLLVLLAKPIVPLNVLIAAVISAVWIYFIPKLFKKNIRKKKNERKKIHKKKNCCMSVFFSSGIVNNYKKEYSVI